ncbi:hypothetical protein CYMTET_14073 [Cymbomonas tetramitiformis]|uniref:Uncharacterized protein n=1 Tax=Cymbomonas tetramitiformis TaxID=36881 RepID=A0AAE0GH24_9CHLO|nr:hypothetical protein CYMTET_14073 [Cymbomonas tetramitiformis]
MVDVLGRQFYGDSSFYFDRTYGIRALIFDAFRHWDYCGVLVEERATQTDVESCAFAFNAVGDDSEDASHRSEGEESEDVGLVLYVGHARDYYLEVGNDGVLYDPWQWHSHFLSTFRDLEKRRYHMRADADLAAWQDEAFTFVENYTSVVRGMDEALWVA